MNTNNLPTVTENYIRERFAPARFKDKYEELPELTTRTIRSDIVFARNKETGHKNAIKFRSIKKPNIDYLIRLIRELWLHRVTLQGVNSPYLVPVVDFVEDEERGYGLVMPFYPNGSLLKLEELKTIDVVALASIVIQVALGLDTLTSKNLLHRDLHYQNILITGETQQGNPTVAITDLELTVDSNYQSKNQPNTAVPLAVSSDNDLWQRITQEDFYMGSPYFTSIEQIYGRKLFVESDLYSLAMSIFSLLRNPFDNIGSLQDIEYAHIHRKPVNYPKILQQHNRAIQKPSIVQRVREALDPGSEYHLRQKFGKIIMRLLSKNYQNRVPNHNGNPALALAKEITELPWPKDHPIRTEAFFIDAQSRRL